MLNGINERSAGTAEGYEYSDAFKAAVDSSGPWTEEALDSFLESPMRVIPGTKMVYPGVSNAQDRQNILAYLNSINSDGSSSGLSDEAALSDIAKTVKTETTSDKDLAINAKIPQHGVLHLGRVAEPEEIAAWDIDIRPDGQGLPVGGGNAIRGGEIYDTVCAFCHGVFGEGKGRWPVLAGGFDTLTDDRPEKTIGSYWPYLSTVYDYVRRAMPFGYARSLSDDDVYALTAYLLYLNDLAEEDFELTSENFNTISLPNVDNFVADTRAEEPMFVLSGEPCMKDCAEGTATVVQRARILDVTPDVEEDEVTTGEID
jgi:cytochrome c